MRSRWLHALSTGVLAASLAACGSEGPRTLVLADAAGDGPRAEIEARVTAHTSTTKRPVRVMRASPEDAVKLASRGEVDLAIVPEPTDVGSFVAAAHGVVSAHATISGVPVQVLVVNGQQHPKVDTPGATDLARALAK